MAPWEHADLANLSLHEFCTSELVLAEKLLSEAESEERKLLENAGKRIEMLRTWRDALKKLYEKQQIAYRKAMYG